MEDFKIKYFNSEQPGAKFPSYTSLPDGLCDDISKKLSGRLGVLNDSELVKVIAERATFLKRNVWDADFDFSTLFNELGIPAPKNLYINWYQFDQIDIFNFDDFTKYFEFIWYPGPDQIELFSEELTWIVSVDESGYLTYINLRSL
jgi:hypothetical protein